MSNNLPKHSTSYWRDSVNLPTFPTLEDEKIMVDVGIVGAGITGFTTAYLLSKQGLNVCLIDAGMILNGTTGHTTAKVTAQHGLIYDELINHFGEENAKLYYEANKQAKNFIENTIEEHKIHCNYTSEDAYIYTESNDYITKLENEYEAYEKLNIEGALTVKTDLPFTVKKALKMSNQAHFHPTEYLKSLLQACENNGVKIYEQT